MELTKGEARVYLSSSPKADGADGSQADYEGAARLVAEHAPTEMNSVEIVRLVAGVEATRVTLRRTPKNNAVAQTGLAAGQEIKSVDEFVPDLTDNEKSELALKIFKGLEAANFTVDKFEITRRKATVFVTPTKFREHARNVGRASRVVASFAPVSVEEIEVVTMNAGLETARVAGLAGLARRAGTRRRRARKD